MKIRRAVLSMAAVLALGAALVVPSVRAGVEDQMTNFQFTFAKPIQVPGVVLQPGSYWFMIKDAQNAQNDTEKNIIAVYNADKTKLIANIPARPAQRKEVGYSGHPPATSNMDGVELQIAEGSPNRPATLLKWFYPGVITGHQFVYTDREEKAFDEGTKTTIVLKSEKHTDGTYGASWQQ